MNALTQKLIGSKFPSFLIEGFSQKNKIHELAQYFLCEKQSSCGTCLSCRWVSKDAHPDWIKADGSVKMEELREFLYQLRLHPAQAPFRIFSISDFQDANASVQNALLKTLEEPLERRRILIGATNAKAVLPTIRSRCIRIPEDAASTYSMNAESDWSELFRAIENGSELQSFKKLDEVLKNRETAAQAIKEMSMIASQKNWPGVWRKLAPHLEEAREALDRNLNPRIVWDRLFETQHEAH